MENKLLKKLNEYTRREFKEDEVYIFSVILCDNEIDRDNECFSFTALNEMKSLFLGKTGIFDHNARSQNQTARIFETEVVTDEEKLTKSGEAYSCLKATAYMVRTKSNEDLIREIDGGIKKEVSVSCSAGKRVCSIKSALDIKSVKATSFCYDKKLDRLRYDFSLRVCFNAVENEANIVNILDSEVRVTSFSFMRKCVVSEVPAINSKVITAMGGRYPIKLDVKGNISACKKSFFNLDEAVRTGEALRIKLSGAVFPDMKLKSYEVKGSMGGTAYVAMELTATASEEGIK